MGTQQKLKRKGALTNSEGIESLIHTIRGQKVILDSDLAQLYGVETRTLNQAIKRNRKRFPEDFLFQLSPEETKTLGRLRSQIVILKRGQHRKYQPYAFTENGAIMAANVLNSSQAVRMSVLWCGHSFRCANCSAPQLIWRANSKNWKRS